jgi:2-phosphosulfolactate phosphatase
LNFHRATLDTCADAEGAVVVIDVIRAFTSAAYAFGAGAAGITLVSTIAEAFALREQNPDALIMGEDGGKPIPGFDFSNSPTHYLDIDLSGRSLIQRTTHGTQGVVRSVRADTLLTASFPCARATAARLRALQPQQVTFVVTGWEGDGLWGDEDMACADYLEALLRGLEPNPAPYLDRVRHSPTGLLFADPTVTHFSPHDLPLCVALDRFDFAMQVERQNGLLHMTPVAATQGGEESADGDCAKPRFMA